MGTTTNVIQRKKLRVLKIYLIVTQLRLEKTSITIEHLPRKDLSILIDIPKPCSPSSLRRIKMVKFLPMKRFSRFNRILRVRS